MRNSPNEMLLPLKIPCSPINWTVLQKIKVIFHFFSSFFFYSHYNGSIQKHMVGGVCGLAYGGLTGITSGKSWPKAMRALSGNQHHFLKLLLSPGEKNI